MTALKEPHWHALAAEEVLKALESDLEGLAPEEAARRLRRFGPNLLPAPKPPSLLWRFLLQFHNVLIYVLLVAGLVSLLLGHLLDAAVILAVVVINAAIGVYQEGRAERAMRAIRRMLAPRARVRRGGRLVEVPARELVPGDVVWLQAGDRVPADLRILRAHRLEAMEAVLTGESVPVAKGVDPVAPDAPVAERSAMLFSGTLVTRGEAEAVVVATGADTEIGRIGRLLAEVETVETPLLRQFGHFARRLTLAILALTLLTAMLGVGLHGLGFDDTFLAAVSLAVAAIPEGLPAILTIIMAIGVERMARERAIVRRLPAVETLGAVDVICSDKTGTLTRNEMTVVGLATASASFAFTGTGYAPEGVVRCGEREVRAEREPLLAEALRAAVLCNDADVVERDGLWEAVGDPMEAALVVAARKAGLDPAALRREWVRRDGIPFDPLRRYMATLHRSPDGEAWILLKGAPEEVLARSAGQRGGKGVEPLDPDYWSARMERMAGEGARLLAVAARRVADGTSAISEGDVAAGFVLLGLFALVDPPREDAIESVARCRSAGIRVKMITGDHAATASAIAARLGLERPQAVLTGAAIDELDDRRLGLMAERVAVFARTAPEHKLRLVRALQARGHVVAMTGDGVNDAPALRRADVGIAMGRTGTEAAKEAAQVVLADDRFATIARAVEEGRVIYDNIQKALLFVLPTNAAEALIVAAAVALGWTLPIAPVQILWINMITAVTLAIAIAFEAPEEDVMRRPPRAPDEPLLSPFLIWRVVLVGTVSLISTFAVFAWMRSRGAPLEEARTVAVHALVAAEGFYLLAVRRFEAPAWAESARRGAAPAVLAIGLVALAQLLFTYLPPFQTLFRTSPPDAAGWLAALAAGLPALLVVEAEKGWLRSRRRIGRRIASPARP